MGLRGRRILAIARALSEAASDLGEHRQVKRSACPHLGNSRHRRLGHARRRRHAWSLRRAWGLRHPRSLRHPGNFRHPWSLRNCGHMKRKLSALYRVAFNEAFAQIHRAHWRRRGRAGRCRHPQLRYFRHLLHRRYRDHPRYQLDVIENDRMLRYRIGDHRSISVIHPHFAVAGAKQLRRRLLRRRAGRRQLHAGGALTAGGRQRLRRRR